MTYLIFEANPHDSYIFISEIPYKYANMKILW